LWFTWSISSTKVHLTPGNNQPTGSKYEPWGLAGDPARLWTVKELKTLRAEIEDAGLVPAAIENIDPAHWHDISSFLWKDARDPGFDPGRNGHGVPLTSPVGTTPQEF
jgi:hypothetical protein